MNHLRVLKDVFATHYADLPELLQGTSLVATWRNEPFNLNVRIRRTAAASDDFPQGPIVAKFVVSLMPGCSAMAVTSKLWLSEELRGRGLGGFLRDLRVAAYRAAGFQAELCTVRSDNGPQDRIMTRRGSKMLLECPSDHGGTFKLWLTDLAVRT